MSDVAGHIFGEDEAAHTAAAPTAGRRRAVARPVAELAPAAVALSRQQGTYESPGHLCDVCRQWVDAIWYVLPLWPRTRFCAKCAAGIGQGPEPGEGGHG